MYSLSLTGTGRNWTTFAGGIYLDDKYFSYYKCYITYNYLFRGIRGFAWHDNRVPAKWQTNSWLMRPALFGCIVSRPTNYFVESRTPHRMFVVVPERAAASSWYGQDQDRRCTGRNEEHCCIGPNEERCGLLGGDRADSSWWPWRDASALVVGCLGLVASRWRSVGRFSLVRCPSSAAGSTDSWSESELLCDWQSVSQSVRTSWCRAHSGTCDQMLFSFRRLMSEFCCPLFCWAPSLTRGRVCHLSV
jgi:hypothetical protein